MTDPTYSVNKTAEAAEHPQHEAANNPRYYSGIDWVALLFRLLENIHWILLTAILFGAAAGYYVKNYVAPVYQATSKIYIAGSETTISLADLQLGSTLAADYQEVFKIWHVHEMVDQRLGLNYSYGKLAGMVSVSNPSSSHILYINIKSSDPQEAKQLADTYAEVIMDYISEKMELRRPRLLQVAQVPSSPISPNIKASVIRAFMAGGMLTAAVVVLLYLLDDKIRTDDDIEKATGLATLGTLMKQEHSNKNDPVSAAPQAATSEHCAEIQTDLSLGYAGDEAINMICSSIMFAGKNVKRIAITSHEADDGKTFIATRIAHSMASRGKKTLLIDGDLRKASITWQYKVGHTAKGLAHLLSGQCALEEAVYSTNIPNLYLLPAGEPVKTPLPLLTSPDFDQLMEHFNDAYDLVIIDSPPIGVVIDAAEIARRCDGSLLVLHYNKQTKSALRHMQRLMEQTGTPIIGCILNLVAPKKLSQKRYYYRYGSDYYYADTDHKKKGKSGSRWRKQ